MIYSNAQIMVLIALIAWICISWLMAMIDTIRSDFREPNGKMIWVIILIFVPPPISTLLYEIFGKQQKATERANSNHDRSGKWNTK